MDQGALRQTKEFLPDAADQQVMIPPGKIGAADGIEKEDVAGEEMAVTVEADPAGGMARNMDDPKLQGPDGQDLILLEEAARLR
jgi:hypothetical protein